MRKFFGVVLVLALTQGCAGLSTADKNLISTGSATGQNTLGKWDTLSDAQKKDAFFTMTATHVVLDNHVSERPVPAQFQPFLDALAAQAAKK